MSKSALIIDTPENCFECPCFMEMGWRCQCRLDINEDVHDGRPDWCPLAEESSTEAIPVELVEKLAVRIKELSNDNPSYWNVCDVVDRQKVLDTIEEMLEDWRKENGHI